MSPAGLPIEQVLGEYSLSYSLRRDVSFLDSFTRALDDLLRTQARASVLFPDYPEWKTPALSYKTRLNYFNSDHCRPFRGRILTLTLTLTYDTGAQFLPSKVRGLTSSIRPPKTDVLTKLKVQPDENRETPGLGVRKKNLVPYIVASVWWRG